MRQPTQLNKAGNQTVDISQDTSNYMDTKFVTAHQTEQTKVPDLLQQLDPYGTYHDAP